ncbi:unnamed protein product [Meloidogyne enterolobii]|uniref:Uncharacterized protein n=1 Tax=Meloidogyne enterolobii TaxID=390850 RepID=A0ACB1ASF8_MELEN
MVVLLTAASTLKGRRPTWLSLKTSDLSEYLGYLYTSKEICISMIIVPVNPVRSP